MAQGARAAIAVSAGGRSALELGLTGAWVYFHRRSRIPFGSGTCPDSGAGKARFHRALRGACALAEFLGRLWLALWVGLCVLPLRKWRARKEKGLVLELERVLPMGCSEAITLRLWSEGCSCSRHSYFQPWPIGRSASDELGLAAEEFGMLVTGRGWTGVSVLHTPAAAAPHPAPVRSLSEVLLRPESCLWGFAVGGASRYREF